jgi:hypothetical protein
VRAEGMTNCVAAAPLGVGTDRRMVVVAAAAGPTSDGDSIVDLTYGKEPGREEESFIGGAVWWSDVGCSTAARAGSASVSDSIFV